MGKRIYAPNNCSPMTRLPDQLLFSIFQRVPADQIASSLALVCRQWREQADDPLLWKVSGLETWELRVTTSRQKIITTTLRKRVITLSVKKKQAWCCGNCKGGWHRTGVSPYHRNSCYH